jgi:hypothetical protein
MITKTITMLKASEGYVLKKGNVYTSSVMLREDESSDGWEEIPKEEYEKIMNEEESEDAVDKV